MKKIISSLVLVLAFYGLQAQVGIGTTVPETSSVLDITSSDKGVLVPRINLVDVTNLTTPINTPATGLLIWNTNASVTGGNGIGFYFYNGAQWTPITQIASNDHDFYEEGTTTAPDNINDDIFTQGNVAIGKTTAGCALDIVENVGDKAVKLELNSSDNVVTSVLYINNANTGSLAKDGIHTYSDGNSNGIKTGLYNESVNSGNGNQTGVYNFLRSISQANQTGMNTTITNSGNGTHWGIYNNLNGSGTGLKYGVFNNISSSAGGQHFGVYSNVLKLGSYAGYFLGDVSIGTTNANNYILPASRGTANQIMQTDGTGQLYWVNNTNVGAERIDDLLDGKSDVGPSFTGSSIFLGVNSGSNDDGSNNHNIGVGYRALSNNTTGNGNTAIGHSVMLDNISGRDNTAIGDYALHNNTANFNTAVGVHSLINNTTGLRNIAIGGYSQDQNISGEGNTALGYFSFSDNTSGNYNTTVGHQSGDDIEGDRNIMIGAYSGVNSIANTTRNLNDNIFIGYRSGYGETNNSRLYIENSDADNNNALIYGEFDNNILRTNSEFQIGNPTITGYAFPTIDGTANQIIQTDGSGQLNWVDPSNLDVEDHDFYEVGTTSAPNDINDNMFTRGNLAIGKNTANYPLDIVEIANSRVINISLDSNINAASSGLYITNNSTGNGSNKAIENMLGGTSNSGIIAIENEISNSGTGLHIGIENTLSGSGDGTRTSTYNRISSNGNGTHYGTRNILSGDGNGTKYGTHTVIQPDNGGTHYGIYSNVTKSGSFAGYFLGDVSIGTTSTNNYIFPASRGTNNQIIQTDGSGQLSWVNPASILSASNGLSINSGDTVLGGTLNQATTITQGTNNLVFNLNSSGDFLVQDNGVNHFEVRSTGLTYFGDDTYWTDGSTTGTTIANLTDDGDDGRLRIHENGITSVDLDANSGFIFNEQGLDRDFRIEGDTEVNLFRVDAANNRIGISEGAPSFDMHLKQSTNSQAGSGGIGFESSANGNNWKIYHSGTNISFAENGVRRAYITAATGAYVPTSDRRLKKNITEVESVLEKVNNLKTYRYLYKDQNSSDKKTIGFMAQDVQPLFPELVEKAEDGYFGLNYAGFGVVAIKAIQEQQLEIATLKAENESLKAKQKELDERLKKLEDLVLN